MHLSSLLRKMQQYYCMRMCIPAEFPSMARGARCCCNLQTKWTFNRWETQQSVPPIELHKINYLSNEITLICNLNQSNKFDRYFRFALTMAAHVVVAAQAVHNTRQIFGRLSGRNIEDSIVHGGTHEEQKNPKHFNPKLCLFYPLSKVSFSSWPSTSVAL